MFHFVLFCFFFIGNHGKYFWILVFFISFFTRNIDQGLVPDLQACLSLWVRRHTSTVCDLQACLSLWVRTHTSTVCVTYRLVFHCGWGHTPVQFVWLKGLSFIVGEETHQYSLCDLQACLSLWVRRHTSTVCRHPWCSALSDSEPTSHLETARSSNL